MPRPFFWQINFAGWVVVGALLVIVRAGLVPIEFMIGVKVVFVGLGFLVSVALRALYRPLLEREVPLVAVMLTCAAASVVGGVVWTAPYNLFLSVAAPYYLDMPYPVSTIWELLDGGVQHLFMLLAWSAIYVGITYHARMQRQRDAAVRAEADATRARLEALRYQLNPHFLFNALNSVSSLVHRDADAAERMIGELGALLRRALESPVRETWSLGEELAFIRQYLDIERVRFGERLQAHYEIDPATRPLRVPSLLLQPLVENAIHHALAQREQGGRITIRAHVHGTLLRLSVEDEGYGHAEPDASPGGGLGLANTRDRLAHACGTAFRLERTEGATGSTVTIELLAVESSEEAMPAYGG